MKPGNIIVLNGASSASKAALLNSLQEMFDIPYLHISTDKLVSTQPCHPEPSGQEEPLFDHSIYNMHLTIASLSRAGKHIIADHALIDGLWIRQCADLFYELPALLIGVRSPLDGVEAAAQSDMAHLSERRPSQFSRLYSLQDTPRDTPRVYDLEVDLSLLNPSQCACAIKNRLLEGPPPMAWRWLKVWTDPNKHRGWIRANAA